MNTYKLDILRTAVAQLTADDSYVFIRVDDKGLTRIVADCSLPGLMQTTIAIAHSFASNAPKTARIDDINNALFDAVRAGTKLAVKDAEERTDYGAH